MLMNNINYLSSHLSWWANTDQQTRIVQYLFWGWVSQFSCSIVSNSLQPHVSQHARAACSSWTSGVHSNWCPSSQWCHPAISSSVVPLSSWPQSLPASESFPMSQLFAWGGQSTGASALVSSKEHPGLISFRMDWLDLLAVQGKHRFFGAQPSSQSNSHIHTWPLEKQ